MAFTIAVALPLVAALASAQNLPVKWEELTSGDFARAVTQAQGVCLLPFGILEKHGPHLPLGTDLINVRFSTVHGAEQEYAVVFPEYYFGQIFEAKHEPGTIAYSPKLQMELFPDHYAGDGAVATRELGEFDMKAAAANIANAIRAIKSDQVSPRLQNEFFGLSRQPINTKQ